MEITKDEEGKMTISFDHTEEVSELEELFLGAVMAQDFYRERLRKTDELFNGLLQIMDVVPQTRMSALPTKAVAGIKACTAGIAFNTGPALNGGDQNIESATVTFMGKSLPLDLPNFIIRSLDAVNAGENAVKLSLSSQMFNISETQKELDKHEEELDRQGGN